MSQPTRGGDRADREDPPAGSPVSTDGADESVVERMAEPVARRLADVRGWCRRRPAICAVLGFLLLVGGGLLFLSATGERNLFLAVLIAVVSAGVGAVGLLLLNEPVSQYLQQPQNRNRGRWLGFGGLAAGLVVVWLAILVASPALAVVGAVIVLMALLAINALLLSGTAQTMNLFRLGGLGLLVIGPILIWIGDGVDLLSIIGVVVWIVGLVLFKVGLPPWIDEEPQRRRVSVSVASVVATALGIGLLYLAAVASVEPALLFGLTVPIVGLSALGISTARFDPSPRLARIVLAIGLLVLLAGAVLTFGIVRLPEITLLAVAVIAAIGAWFVFRGEALIAVLLLGFVFGWVLVDRNTGEPSNPFPDADVQLLALGDSYISGEGATRFFDGTNVVGEGGNQCRRAPTAYPFRVAERLGSGLIFLACSGAKTTDMDNQGTAPDPFPDIGGGEDQLQRLLAVHGDEVAALDAVLVSIGGNDVGFGTIIKACLLPQSCAVPDRVDSWLRNVSEARDQLVASYGLLRDTVGADTPIVAMTYPIIVRPRTDCALVIDDDEIDFVVQFTTALNAMLESAAAEAGVNLFTGSVDAFDGRLLCDDDPATNFLHLSPTDGPFADQLLPANWVHGSMHPRADGHELIADLLASDPGDGEPQGYLVDLLASVEQGGPANPDPQPGAIVDPPAPEYEELPDDEWIQERLYETAGDLVPPVGLLLIGGLIAAFGLIKAEVPFLDFLNPSNNRPGDRNR